eukprot:jgi/Undpi1/8761/HiC_scaffold_25.g11223.m1
MAMKEFELADVSAGPQDDGYYGDETGGGIDAGQQSLLGGQMGSGEEKGGVGGGGGASGGGQGQTVWCGCLSLVFYQQFFQVDTKDVTERWLHSISIRKRETGFLDLVETNPDAYGPFWNSTSLIFLIALTTNLSSGVYDLNTLVTSTWLVYGFAAGVPLALWLVLNQLDVALPLVQLVCMYGYSLGVFLPAVLICVLPIPYISLVVLAAAGSLSVVFLLRALTPVLLARNAAMAAPVMAGLGRRQKMEEEGTDGGVVGRSEAGGWGGRWSGGEERGEGEIGMVAWILSEEVRVA